MEWFTLLAYSFVPTIIIAVLLVSIGTQLGPLYKRKRMDDKIFLAMWCVLIVCISCDIIALVLYMCGTSLVRETALVSTNLVMILHLVFIYLWTLFIDFRLYKSRKRLRRMRLLTLIPLFFVLVLLVINLFTNIVFYVTPEGTLEMRPLWLLYILVQVLYIVGTSSFLVKYKRKSGGLHFFPVKSFIIPFMAGAVGEVVLPGMSLPTAGATIGYLLIYFGMLRENTYEDPVTGFYNSFFLERVSQEASAGTFDFSSAILFYSDEIGDYLAQNGIIAANNLMRDTAMTLREELPEGCETMYMGSGRFLIISKVSKEQEEAIRVLINIVTETLSSETGEILHFKGCYAFRKDGQDPGSLLSELITMSEEAA